MPGTERNRPWELDTFLDSLVRNLDEWQETLAVKGITRPLTYTVQDVALELQCFPQFDGREVRFVTASPGDAGASALRFQLGSISASSIRDTAPRPISRDEVVIEGLEDLNRDTRDALSKVGVKTESDLRRIEERNVDLGRLTGGEVHDYSDLAQVINKAKRARLAPTVRRVDVARAEGQSRLTVEGENLALLGDHPEFPAAALGGQALPVLEASADRIVIGLPTGDVPDRPARFDLALDPFAVLSMELQP